jgi:molybdate transport system ATP-binding protein
MRLVVEQIELRAGAFRLGPLSLAAGDGEYLIVLGPTGAGKTLTLEAIAGLRAPSAGRIVMDGRDVTRSAPETRRIGFLYQDSLLFPHLSVRHNLAYGAHRLPRPERAATIARIARMLELEPLLERMPGGLSGGERQRAALGRALATNPALLLLDEPMAALDPNSRYALRRTLRALHRELGTTAIHVTHNFPEALALGDRIAILIEGRILQIGAPGEVFAHPGSAEIARFLRTASLSADGGEALPGEGALTIYPRGLALRAEPGDGGALPLLVADEAEVGSGPAAGSGDDALAARVVAIEGDGGAIRLRLSVGLELRASLRAGAPGAEALAEGAGVWIKLPRAR